MKRLLQCFDGSKATKHRDLVLRRLGTTERQRGRGAKRSALHPVSRWAGSVGQMTQCFSKRTTPQRGRERDQHKLNAVKRSGGWSPWPNLVETVGWSPQPTTEPARLQARLCSSMHNRNPRCACGWKVPCRLTWDPKNRSVSTESTFAGPPCWGCVVPENLEQGSPVCWLPTTKYHTETDLFKALRPGVGTPTSPCPENHTNTHTHTDAGTRTDTTHNTHQTARHRTTAHRTTPHHTTPHRTHAPIHTHTHTLTYRQTHA